MTAAAATPVVGCPLKLVDACSFGRSGGAPAGPAAACFSSEPAPAAAPAPAPAPRPAAAFRAKLLERAKLGAKLFAAPLGAAPAGFFIASCNKYAWRRR